jgi:uncharacterized protein
MFNLLPRDTAFYDMFDKLAEHAVTSATHLRELTERFPNVGGIIQRIRDEEHAADEIAHAALDRLDRTFITPFDREDIHELVGGLDNIIDKIDELARRFLLFHVHTMDEGFRGQVHVLVKGTECVSEAVHRLRRSRKLSDLSDRLIELHRLENVGDDNNHAAISRLFEGSIPPLEVMKWKELHDLVETAIDHCEDVGDTLERIVLKNG